MKKDLPLGRKSCRTLLAIVLFQFTVFAQERDWNDVGPIQELILKADAGDSEASLRVARRLLNGIATDHDIEKAMSFYEQSGEQGNPLAWFELGEIHDRGKWVSESKTNADLYYLKALRLIKSKDARGESLLPRELFIIGKLSFEGRSGEVKNEKVGIDYLEKAAIRGDLDAMCEIGVYNLFKKEAVRPLSDWSWLYKAASLGHNRSILTLHGPAAVQGISKDIADDAKKSIKKGIDFHRMKASSGDVNSAYILAKLEYNGVVPDVEIESVDSLIKLADQGNTSAMVDLASIFVGINSAKIDLMLARKYATMAKSRRHPMAEQLLLMIEEKK